MFSIISTQLRFRSSYSHFIGDACALPVLLDLLELVRINEDEHDHRVDDHDPPEHVDADAPPLVEQLAG